jgi:hypothetical protein
MIAGPAKSGKTWTALEFATALNELSGGGRIALVDSEGRSSELYAGIFDFDVLTLDNTHPEIYRKILATAIEEGINTLIFDSFSHSWIGREGALALAEVAAGRFGGNTWAGWSDVRPLIRDLFDDILRAPIHVIATVRTVESWEIQEDSSGKKVPVKVGLKAQTDKEAPYIFDAVLRMDMDHNGHFWETRIRPLEGRSFPKPGKEVIETIWDWMNEGQVGIEDESDIPVVIQEWERELALTPPPTIKKVKRQGPDPKEFWSLVSVLDISNSEAKKILKEKGLAESISYLEKQIQESEKE